MCYKKRFIRDIAWDKKSFFYGKRAQSAYSSQSLVLKSIMSHVPIKQLHLGHFYSRKIQHELQASGFNHLHEEFQKLAQPCNPTLNIHNIPHVTFGLNSPTDCSPKSVGINQVSAKVQSPNFWFFLKLRTCQMIHIQLLVLAALFFFFFFLK